MRAVFVAHTHPATPHVASQRFARFADAMASRGHKITLLTQPKEGEAGIDPDEIGALALAHNWSRPLHLACSTPQGLGRGQRDSKAPLLRQAYSAWSLMGDGHLPGWTAAGRRYAQAVAVALQPDLIWTVFGSVSDMVVGRELSRAAACPYVVDFKDSWSRFIPGPVRRAVARRFRTAGGYTANAQFHADIARRWFPDHPAVVVYSGVNPDMIGRLEGARDSEIFRLVLVGSLYDPGRLNGFLDGIARWLATLDADGRRKVEVAYAGGDYDLLASAASSLPCAIRAERYLPYAQLGDLCRSAAATGYVWSPHTFHHKLLELISCRRPVIAFPGELPESIALAQRFGGDLRAYADPAALAEGLGALWRGWLSGEHTRHEEIGPDPTWDAFAKDLEAAFASVLARSFRSGVAPQ